jgi:hypothetical protein
MNRIPEPLKLIGLLLFIIITMGIAGKSDFEEEQRVEAYHENMAFRPSRL